MSAEEAIVAKLEADSAVTTLVGTDPIRIYPHPLPQKRRDADPTTDHGRTPAITYRRMEANYFYSLQGFSGLEAPVYEITCWGIKYPEVLTLAKAVRAVLDGKREVVGSTSLQKVELVDEFDGFQEQEELRFRVLRYEVWFCE